MSRKYFIYIIKRDWRLNLSSAVNPFIGFGGLCAERAGYRKPDAVTVHAVRTVTRGAE